MRMVINIYNEFMPLRYLCILATRRRCAVLCTGNMYKVIDVFGCFFFNAHGYKYITLNADLSEYIIIFMSHLFGCVRMCVIFRHRRSFIVDRERKKASSGRYTYKCNKMVTLVI